jgi:regulator of replication initiation timing
MDENESTYDNKVELLQDTIEEVRRKLYASMKDNNGDMFSLETYRLSDRLDRLIVEFLKVKEKISDTSQ